MSSKVMELYNRLIGKKPKMPAEMTLHSRNIGDVSISIEEGLSNTRKITISAWNPAMASALFWEVRGGLRDQVKGDAYESLALLKTQKDILNTIKESKDETMSKV